MMDPHLQLQDRAVRELYTPPEPENPDKSRKDDKKRGPMPRKQWDAGDWFIFFIFIVLALVALAVIATIGR